MTMNSPVAFPGTAEQAQTNFYTHHWGTNDGDNFTCSACDAKEWHAAAKYPCGEEPERQTTTFTPTYIDDCPICQGCKERGEAPIPGHNNCIYGGNAMGHRKGGHCTAHACY